MALNSHLLFLYLSSGYISMSPSFSAFAAVSFDIPIGGLVSPNIGENGIYFESANDAPEVVTPGLFCLCPSLNCI